MTASPVVAATVRALRLELAHLRTLSLRGRTQVMLLPGGPNGESEPDGSVSAVCDPPRCRHGMGCGILGPSSSLASGRWAGIAIPCAARPFDWRRSGAARPEIHRGAEAETPAVELLLLLPRLHQGKSIRTWSGAPSPRCSKISERLFAPVRSLLPLGRSGRYADSCTSTGSGENVNSVPVKLGEGRIGWVAQHKVPMDTNDLSGDAPVGGRPHVRPNFV